MSQLSKRCHGHKYGIVMIEGAVIAAREVEQLSERCNSLYWSSVIVMWDVFR